MVSNIKTIIGTKVKNARSGAHLTQEQLAFDIEVSIETISNVERGKVLPSIDTLLKISQKFQFPITDFFCGLDNKKIPIRRIEAETQILHNIKSLNDKELKLVSKQIEVLIEYLHAK